MPVFGLRTRMIGALLAVSVLTLGVAALALLPPLESRLRRDDLESLTQSTAATAPAFETLAEGDLRPHSRDVRELARALERRTGARVIVFDARGRKLIDTDPLASPDGPRGGRFDDVRKALATGKRVDGTRNLPEAGQAYVSEPVKVDGQTVVVAARRSLEDARSAVDVVRRAFLVAALAGLVAALVLGIALATTLLRRLRRLRDAARRLATEGLDAEVPRDNARDEVGELSRGFSTMQARLQQQEGVRRAFVATASHELRTPLTSLQGMLELLDDDLLSRDVEAARVHAAAARDQARRLTGLANDLLELTRLDSDFALRRELVELGEICRAVVGEFEARSAERDVDLSLNGFETPCWVLGDPGSIARVVRIMVENALTFSPSHSQVTATVALNGASASVRVADSGPGVTAEERDLIFERFRRGSAGGGVGGFGLGLAIGRELAERMDGQLELEQAEAGACFALRLPVAPFLDGDAPAVP